MHRTWIVLGSIAATVSLAFGTYLAVNVIAHEEVREVDVFAVADVERVDVGGDNTNVEVVGRDVAEIRVVADVDHGLRRTRTTAEVRDGTLVVDNDCPAGPPIHCRVDYRIVVPSATPVSVDVDNGTITARDLQAGLTAKTRNGRVDVARIDGFAALSSRNGSVHGRNLRGDASARTSNGRVELSFLAAPTHVAAESDNGSIEIVVPDDGGAYQVRTDNVVGSTDAAVRIDPNADRSITADTRNGSITVRYPTG